MSHLLIADGMKGVFVICLQRLAQLLLKAVNALHLLRNLNMLRASAHALIAADAVVRLSLSSHALKVGCEVSSAQFLIVACVGVVLDKTIVEAIVEMLKHARDINAVGAGHAVLAVGAGDSREAGKLVPDLLEQRYLSIRKWCKRGKTTEVILQVLHVGHTAQYGEDLGLRSRKSERPRGDTALRSQRFECLRCMIIEFAQATAQQGLHHHYGDITLCQFVV